MWKRKCIFHRPCILKWILQRSYSNKNRKSYSATVLLPHTNFPLRISGNALLERDEKTNEICTSEELYLWQRSPQRTGSKGEYVLHDGPPYANGPLHMGHAINKVLKDIVIRSKLVGGYQVHYRPGWDCHGLPIELKAITESDSDYTGDPSEVRETARRFATETILKQLTVFKSWGVLGDWGNPYRTYSHPYIKNQLIQFYKLYEKDFIYRDLKPVYWSPESRTALAEAELEYNDKHISQTVTVKCEVVDFPGRPYMLPDQTSKVFALIWTTAPWTLPGNQAIAFSPTLTYSVIKATNKNEFYIIASELLQTFAAAAAQMELNSDSCVVVMETFQGSALTGLSYVHPMNGAVLPFLAGDHVTCDKGTGLVHTAPAHGPDDYLLALRHNLPIVNLVGGDGHYTPEAGPALNQLPVLGAGNATVIQLLAESVVLSEHVVHSYPYDWRTGTPVILRASEQWFLNTDRVKETASKCLEGVSIWPRSNSTTYRRTLLEQLQRRPYWCISRQRKWGVPIPVFYDRRNGRPLINERILSAVMELLDRTGTMDFWFEMSETEMLTNVQMDVPMEEIEKGQDIFDIWFDSGISWSSALDGKQIADMYLEGLDQFTGWFQSSLITSVCLRDSAPYAALYVHGHALDQHGAKMSKSRGNVIDPARFTHGNGKALGVDTLRWWVACHASRGVAALVSDRVMHSSAEEVHRVRAVLRFVLGALADYSGKQSVEQHIHANLHVLDKYLLHLLWDYNSHVENYIEECNFSKVCSATMHLITNQISATYLSAIKDRLYCDEAEHLNRLTAQYTLFCILCVLLKNIATVVPHLSEEVYMHLPEQLKLKLNNKVNGAYHRSFFQTDMRPTDEELLRWKNHEINEFMQGILSIRRDVYRKIKNEDATKMSVTLNISRELDCEMRRHFATLANAESQLVLLLQVANVSIQTVGDVTDDFSLAIKRSNKFACSRCRRRVVDVTTSSNDDSLCDRCTNVIAMNNVYKAIIKQQT